jgi:CxxC motif-containing protein (DUF1111 family)
MERRFRTRGIVAAIAAVSIGTVVAQTQMNSRGPRQAPGRPPVVMPPGTTAFGAPLPGLSATRLQAFADGLDDFTDVDTPESGLGPAFNNNSCAACHTTPIPGARARFS